MAMKKIVIPIIAFVTCFALGFGLTYLFVGQSAKKDAPVAVVHETPEPPVKEEPEPVAETEIETVEPVKEVQPEKTPVQEPVPAAPSPTPRLAPVQQMVQNTSEDVLYTVRVSATVPSGDPLTYYLDEKESRSGEFSDVTPGRHTVKAVNTANPGKTASTVLNLKSLVSKAQVNEVLNSGKLYMDHKEFFESNFIKNVSISYGSLDATDLPSSLRAVMQSVSMGSWSSVTVRELTYDNTGKISAMVLSYTR